MTPALLITGGAGFLGVNLARHFLAKQWRVSVLDTQPFAGAGADRVRSIVGDVREAQVVREAARGADFVVHAAAALPLQRRQEILTTTIDGTRIGLETAAALGIKRFVYVSSTAVYGIPDHHPLMESDRLVGVGPYGEAKIAAEGLCQAHRGPNMCVPVLRPKSFIGPERLGIFGLLYDWAASGKHFPLPGGGRKPFQLLDVEDLVQAIELTLTCDAQVANRTFNVGAKAYGALREDFQAVLDYAGFGRRIVALPAGPSLALLEGAYRAKLSPAYPWVFKTLIVDSSVSIQRAETLLGFRPRYSNRDALIRNFEWYLTHRERMPRAQGHTHREPWKQGVLALAKLFF